MEVGDLREPVLQSFSRNLHLVPGDVALAGFEETLSEAWPQSMGDKSLYRPYRILTAFWQVGQLAANRVGADLIVADVGPNLGAINRSVLIGTDYVVIPLGADLYSLQGLKNLGPTLRSWRKLWKRRLSNWNDALFDLPTGAMNPIGYVVQQHSVRLSRPVKAYDRWVRRMPEVYAEAVLQKPGKDSAPSRDPNCLATVKHYRSLMPMAQEKRKPIFKLTSSDGAIGAHAQSVQDAFEDFEKLAELILEKMSDFDE
jgi:cellulose biosynthesis protein BcsQ